MLRHLVLLLSVAPFVLASKADTSVPAPPPLPPKPVADENDKLRDSVKMKPALVADQQAAAKSPVQGPENTNDVQWFKRFATDAGARRFELKQLLTHYRPKLEERLRIHTWGRIEPNLKRENSLDVAQYPRIALPAMMRASQAGSTVTIKEGPYTYAAESNEPGVAVFWVNFGNVNALSNYHRGFKQDEHMVFMIPELGATRVAFDALRKHSSRRDKRDLINFHLWGRRTNQPKPLTVIGALRYIDFDTKNYYGKSTLRGVSEVTFDTAVTLLNPPQPVNVIYIAAKKRPLMRGNTPYRPDELRSLLHMMYAGFAQARAEALLAAASKGETVTAVEVHSGNVGAGAYHGSVRVAAWVQIVAARLAGVNLVAHTMHQKGEWDNAQAEVDATIWPVNEAEVATDVLLQRMVALGARWAA